MAGRGAEPGIASRWSTSMSGLVAFRVGAALATTTNRFFFDKKKQFLF
jgi:hypothetical protein